MTLATLVMVSLAGTAQARSIDLQFSLRVGRESVSFVVPDVQLNESALTVFSRDERVGRHTFTFEFGVSPYSTSAVHLHGTVVRSDNGKPVCSPWIITQIGMPAEFPPARSGHKEIQLTVLPTDRGDAAPLTPE
jgi:hypothetical protein